MDPTDAQLSAMDTIKLVLDWVGVSGDPTVDTTPRGSFLNHMDVLEAEHPRNIGAMSADDFEKYLVLFRIGGGDPSPVLRTKLGLVGRVCRILVGAQPTQAAQNALDTAADAAATALASVQAQLALSQMQLALPSASIKRTVKMSLILDQSNDTEVPYIPDLDHKEGYKRYFDIYKNMPSPDDDVTIEQLSGLVYYMKNGNPPWADFAIFGPHGQRLMCKLKMSGLRLQPDGSFLNVEYKGPPSYWLWEQCYSILKTGLIFLDAAELGPLEAYKERIKKYAMENPPAVWHLIYQADHRMRKEHMERILRRGEIAKAKDSTHPFDPASPWKWVWSEAATGEDKFWKKEFEDPSVLVVTHTKSVLANLQGDAQLAGDRNVNDTDMLHTAPPAMPGIQAPPSSRPVHTPPQREDREPKRPKKADRTADDNLAVFSDGKYSCNKKGLDLCHGYNGGDGSCRSTNGQGRCSKNTDRVHQCHICLQAHPASQCPKAGGGGEAKKRGKKGKGKGRGNRY